MIRPSSKCPYSAAFIRKQKQRLLDERKRVLRAIDAEVEDLRNWSGHDDAGIDQHMADDATALTEQELDVTLIDNAKHILFEISEALSRIEEGVYGWDRGCDCWIREERLRALPWARREIEAQMQLERRFGYDDRRAGGAAPDAAGA